MEDKEKENPKSKIHISKPKLRYRIIIYFLMVVVITLTLVSLAVDFMNPVVEIICYVFAMLLLCVGGYYMVTDIIYLKRNVVKGVIDNNHFVSRVSSDYRFRTIVFTIPGIFGNVIFAVINAIIGLFGQSAWFGSMAAYYILLSFMRISAVRQGRKIAGIEDAIVKKQREMLVYKRNSIVFIFMAVVLAGLVILLEFSDGGKTYPGFTIYAVAAYTFYRIVMAVVNMFKVRKENSPLLMIIRKIGYLDACVSILILQTAMFASFGTDTQEIMIKWMNGMTGTVVFIMVCIFGIHGIAWAEKMKG